MNSSRFAFRALTASCAVYLVLTGCASRTPVESEPAVQATTKSAGSLLSLQPQIANARDRQLTVLWKIKQSDGRSVASASNSLVNRTTNYLRADSFGFALPKGAEISGIEAVVERSRSRLGAVLDDSVLQTIDGQPVGVDHAVAGRQWAHAPETVHYGGPEDLWGLRLNAGQINQPGFGLAIKARMMPFDNPQTAEVKEITLIVHYSVQD